ncbi:hypothetical protein [Flavobacterium sp. HTF]|uniref:hypothetical protein n=1 Tax=Flavobacterium sp. HTF TaxID=2170732 RepID=UPI000D5DE314|nr:hypothetical protein [Flavobacterium sp. HTF]PWB23840.1 hypothetical protein DCO46_13520 [Flavobacterium sp. HTF]
MFKTTHKNKYVFYLILNVFLSIPSFAQIDIAGKWKTNDIVGYTDVAEYSLIKEKEPNFGRRLTFRLDGTFLCDESIQCLNGCFIFTSGTYALVDNDHIHMIVENVRFVGLDCGRQKSHKEDIIRDLGIFYIYKEGDSIRLIPSNAVLQDDKDKMLYIKMFDSFDKEWKSYDYVWEKTDGDKPEEIIKDCVDHRKSVVLSNYKIVFSKDLGYGKVFLLREKENFHYIIYNYHDKKVSLAYPKNKS